MNNNCKRTTHHFLCQTTTRNPAKLYSEHFTISIFIFSIDSLLLYRYFFPSTTQTNFSRVFIQKFNCRIIYTGWTSAMIRPLKEAKSFNSSARKERRKMHHFVAKNKKTPGDKVRSTGITHIGKTKEGNINTCQRGGVI